MSLKLKHLLLPALLLSSSTVFASALPSHIVIDGNSVELLAPTEPQTFNSSVSIDLSKNESEQLKQESAMYDFSESMSQINFKCRITMRDEHRFTNLRPGKATVVYSFDQTCANKYVTGSLTNLSNASLRLYLLDGSGNIVSGPSFSISERPNTGKYHWAVVNNSTSSRGDGYVKTSHTH